MTQAQAYFRTQVESATPLQRIVLLYEGAARFAAAAARQLEEREFESATLSNLRVQNILIELRGALDHDKGGEVAAQLSDLYSAWLRKLADANRRRDAAVLVQLRRQIEEFRSAWAEIEAQGGAA